MNGDDPALIWAVIGVILMIAELLAPGVFLLWIGLAALATAGLLTALPLALPAQLALFAGLATVSVLASRRLLPVRPAHDAPLLNARADELIGTRVTVTQAITDGRGRVRLADADWSADGPDAPVGTRLVVTGVSGNRLSVAPDATRAPGRALDDASGTRQVH